MQVRLYEQVAQLPQHLCLLDNCFSPSNDAYCLWGVFYDQLTEKRIQAWLKRCFLKLAPAGRGLPYHYIPGRGDLSIERNLLLSASRQTVSLSHFHFMWKERWWDVWNYFKTGACHGWLQRWLSAQWKLSIIMSLNPRGKAQNVLLQSIQNLLSTKTPVWNPFLLKIPRVLSIPCT